MMTKDRDYEDILRRALAEAAESIEPTGDGLRRIRHRLDSPRSLRSVFSGCTEWLELRGTRFLIRLDPAIEAARAALSRVQSARGPLAGLLGGRGRRPAGGHRGAPSPPGRLGSAGPWLKPVFAVSAAVAIVVVGVVVLNHETGTPISRVNASGTASAGSSLGGGGTTASSGRGKLPPGVVITLPWTGSGQSKKVKSGLPAVACSPTPAPKPDSSATAPAGGGTGTPTQTATPTPSVTASSTPTVQPTPSATATPSPTSSPATSSPATSGPASTTAAPAAVPSHTATTGAVHVQCGGSTPTTSSTP
ncbi:MAG TPA: hypothetical protein VIF35_09825 [Streptosporangiaceae bacterium]|jgi:hypothetical protein